MCIHHYLQGQSCGVRVGMRIVLPAVPYKPSQGACILSRLGCHKFMAPKLEEHGCATTAVQTLGTDLNGAVLARIWQELQMAQK